MSDRDRFIALFDTLGSEVMPALCHTITLDPVSTPEDVDAILDYEVGGAYAEYTEIRTGVTDPFIGDVQAPLF